MGIRISSWLYRANNAWFTLASLVIFALFSAFVLPNQAAKAESYIGDAGSPDTSFIYTAADLYRFAEAYGPEGRAAYVRARFTFDLVWPLVYTFFLTSSITWAYARAFLPASAWRLANLVPLAAMDFDFLENLSAALVMVRYPRATAVVDVLAPVFTVLKWILVTGSFGLLMVGLLVGLWRWVNARSR